MSSMFDAASCHTSGLLSQGSRSSIEICQGAPDSSHDSSWYWMAHTSRRVCRGATRRCSQSIEDVITNLHLIILFVLQKKMLHVPDDTQTQERLGHPATRRLKLFSMKMY